jgi:hypothetical protein
VFFVPLTDLSMMLSIFPCSAHLPGMSTRLHYAPAAART